MTTPFWAGENQHSHTHFERGVVWQQDVYPNQARSMDRAKTRSVGTPKFPARKYKGGGMKAMGKNNPGERTLYKLTDSEMQTHNKFQWALDTPVTLAPCDHPRLCTADVLHAYVDPDLALLMNPAHANYDPPRLFEATGAVVVTEADKVGTFELTVTRELDLPAWYADEPRQSLIAVQFAILCAQAVLTIWDATFPDDTRPAQAIAAALDWLDNPTAHAARAARAAADAAAESDMEIDIAALSAQAVRDVMREAYDDR